jgi:predicted lipoprotein
MKKTIKYTLLLLAIALVGYKSFYIKKLSEVRKEAGEKFDAAAYTKKLWEERFPAKSDSAVSLTDLIMAIEANPVDAFSKYSNAMAIGNYRYSLVKVVGTVAIVNEDDIMLQISHADSLMRIKLATEFIYGNAIRDASGLLNIKDFDNTTDLNNISEELNKTVRTAVLPSFKKQVKAGDKIEATGAVEINKEHIRLNELELLPVRIKILL